MRASRLSIALMLAACAAGGHHPSARPIVNVDTSRPRPRFAVRGLEWLAWGMPRDIFRALHPSFVEHEHSGCFEGTSKLGPRRMHLGFCFDATGLREVYATIGSTILPETAGTLADVIAELDRAFGPNSDRVHWASATTQAEILREEQSGPYLWLYSVRLAPRATP